MKEEAKATVYTSTRRKRLREGRGFSLEEIRRAGLTLYKAKKLGIPVDKRRKTAHPQNAQTLKENYGTVTPLTEIKGVGKAAENRLMEAGISDCHDLAEADLNILAEKVGYSKKRLEKWQTEARKLIKR